MRRADTSNSFPKRTKRLPSEMSITEPKHFLVARSPKAAPAQAPTAPGRPERVGPTVGRGLAARVCRIKGAWCVILAVVPVMSHTGSMPASAVPVKAMATRNWSGYSLAGSGFTPVTGTFNVPAPFRSASCLEETSVWVGVDGVDNHDLLQAGIAEAGFAPPNNPGRAEWPEPEAAPILCGGPVRIFAWWEDLPSGPVRVNLPVRGRRQRRRVYFQNVSWLVGARRARPHDQAELSFGPTLRRPSNLRGVGGRGTSDNGRTQQPRPVQHCELPRPWCRR